VAGQSLTAAVRTVDDDKHVHSLHGYFIRPGLPKVPTIFHVDRIRDGRSFATRRLTAIQEGDRKSTRLNSSHVSTSYAVFCWQKEKGVNVGGIAVERVSWSCYGSGTARGLWRPCSGR